MVAKVVFAMGLIGMAVAVPAIVATAQERPADDGEGDGADVLELAADYMQQLEMRRQDGDVVERIERPVLTYGDTARANKNGTVWAFGKAGRPLAVLELYQGTAANAGWVHAITLTSDVRVSMATPLGIQWAPKKTQIEPAAIPDAEPPSPRQVVRLRQMKSLARRFTAHEFWDPENSRYELRLLVQPVHRYSDPERGIQDGSVFVLAHGTNPEVVLLVEALGKDLEKCRWHYSLARLGSAELHVELDGHEVWKQERTPGVVGQPSDPYWLFWWNAAAPPAP